MTWRSVSSPARPHSASSASCSRARSPDRRRELGRCHLDVVEPDDRVDLEVPDLDALAHDLAMDLALRRHVDERVAVETRRAAQAAVRGEPVDPGVLGLDLRGWRQVVGERRDPVLGERAETLAHLAAPADPASAADRVDVDAERSCGVEDGGALREPPPPPRWGEDHLDAGRLGHGRRLSPGPASRPAIRRGDGSPVDPARPQPEPPGSHGSSGHTPGRCPSARRRPSRNGGHPPRSGS